MAEVQKQEVTQYTSNLPAYAEPYFKQLMDRAEAESKRRYQAYPFERVAEFTPAQEQIQQRYMGLQAPGQIATGSGFAEAAGRGLLKAADYAPTQFRAQQVGLPQLMQYRMEGPGSFTQAGTAGQYMSPYMQSVVDIQKQEAMRDAKRQQLVEDLGAARQGTYGGSRQLLAGLERERNLGQQLGQIQAAGSQAAFQQAQGQFNTEEQARQNAAIQNLNAALGIQGLGVQTGMQGALANQQAMLEAQRMAEQSKQFGAQNQINAFTQAGQMGQTMGNLGALQQQTDLSRLGAQSQAAAQQQALEQQRLDLDYGDFLRRQDYNWQQLGNLSNVLRGVPVQSNTTVTGYGQSPSLMSQIFGAGLGALGTYNTLKGP
jgi:hypothetical protein